MKNKFLLALLLLIVGLFAINLPAQTATRATEKTLSVTGLKAKVTVRRDGRGIPYIEAGNEADLFFAQGYVMASDRLWQMDLYRRVAGGETAEIFGAATFEEDKRWRKFGFKKIVADSLRYTSPEVVSALENYARGVNAYIASLDDKSFPVEFQILQYRPRPWQPTDSMLIGKILSDALSSSWRQDIVKAMIPADKKAEMFDPRSNYDVILFGSDAPIKTMGKANAASNLPAEKINDKILNQLAIDETIRKNSLARIGFYAENLAASNNWVVSGKKTAAGKPLLANDPHLQAAQPPIWYLVNLSAPNLRAAGVTFPGSPGVVLGHNETIAWGATNVGPDVQDVYLEEFDSANPLRYKTPGGWANAEVRREEIKVRKNPLAPETETRILDVATTRNGPVYFEEAGKRYALKWTALDPKNTEFDAFFHVNRAKNWNDFRAALKRYGGAMQNFIYADTKGNIGWYAAGRIPIRRTGDGSEPYTGATDQGEWTGMIPFEELPHLYNPPQGYIMTANQRVVGTSYKYHDLIARIYVPFRAARLNQLLAAKNKLTVQDMKDFQFDTFSIPNDLIAREIVKAGAASDETIKLLENWDGRMNAESGAAVVANEIRNVFRQKILIAAFGETMARSIGWANEGNFHEKVLRDKPQKWLPKEFGSYADLLKASEAQAIANLTKTLGADRSKWTWGAIAKIRFPHPLAVAPLIGAQFNIAPLPLNGSSSSPNVGAGVSMRLVATPGDWDQTLHGIATGESGNPKSPHWKDQLESWYSGNTPVFPFSQTAVNQATREVWTLEPKP